MKKSLWIVLGVLSGCSMLGPTGDQYCGQDLGLTKGTTDYANCRLQYSAMKQQKNQFSQLLWQNNYNQPKPRQVNVTYSPYPAYK